MEFEKGTFKTGFKEVKKAVSSESVQKIFIAEDISEPMKRNILELSGNIEVAYVSSMRELGKLCGIDVGASCAAKIK